MNILTIRNTTVLTLALFSAMETASVGQTFVSKTGSFDPNGSNLAPFDRVSEAACAAGPAGALAIETGIYAGSTRLDQPMTLTATPAVGEQNAFVRLGQLPTEQTTLTVLAYNTHLFGDAVQDNLPLDLPPLPLGLAWQDPARAAEIGRQLAADDADIVGLSEVWDPDRYLDLVTAAAFPHARYGSRMDGFIWAGALWPYGLNSGLALLSKSNISSFAQISYLQEAELIETMATKGYLVATIEHENFDVGVFVTHMQAFYESDQVSARAAQIVQLAMAVVSYRAQNPGNPVIALGDFNVVAGTSEYTQTMFTYLGIEAGLRDVGANLRCTNPGADANTALADNDLNMYFASCVQPAHDLCSDACAPVGLTCDALCDVGNGTCGVACNTARSTCLGGCTATSAACDGLCGAAVDVCTAACTTTVCAIDCCGGFCNGSEDCVACRSQCRSDCQLDCDDCILDCEGDCDSAYDSCTGECQLDCDVCLECQEACDIELCSELSPDARLDYVLYAPSLDGSVELQPIAAEVKTLRAPAPLGDASFSTDVLSDHEALKVEFQLLRR